MAVDASAPWLHEGGCHCGSLRFEYRIPVAPSAWSVRTCNCSFCRAHRGIATSHPDAEIEFRETAPGTLQRYRFGQRTADFLICTRCGVHVGVVMEVDGAWFGIINLNTLRETPEGLPEPQKRDFGEESPAQRIARRKSTWARARVSVAMQGT